MTTHSDPNATMKVVRAVLPKDYATTAPVNGTENFATDLTASAAAGAVHGGKGFEWYRYDVVSGTVALTGTLVCVVQESDDNSTYTDITGATFANLTTANDNGLHSVAVHRHMITKRYIRLTWTFTNVTAAPLAATLSMLGVDDSAYLPATSELDAFVVV